MSYDERDLEVAEALGAIRQDITNIKEAVARIEAKVDRRLHLHDMARLLVAVLGGIFGGRISQ